LGWLLAGVFVGALPASAHAQLISSDPVSGAALKTAPTELTLQFSESVTQVPGAMKLIAADGTAAAIGPTTIDGHTLRVPLPGTLRDAGYVFVYRIISADSHPVSGAITFTVGDATPAATAGTVAAAVGGGSDGLISALAGIDRWGGYAGILLLVGVPAFVVSCRRDVPALVADAPVRGLVLGGAVLVAVTALASLPLQGARSVGGGLADGFGEIGTVAGTAFGAAALLRLLFVVVVLATLAVAARVETGRATVLTFAALAAIALLFTYARSGHPAVGEYPGLTMLVDVVHFGAVAVWIGGLVVLAVRVLPRPDDGARAVLARWSRVAMTAVVALVVTGSIQAWRELRSVEGFFDTAYGRWIVAKVVGLAVLLALGEYGRRLVRGMVGARPLRSASLGAALADDLAPPADEAKLLRRSVGLELLVAAAVLVATSALVVSTPGVHARNSHGSDMAGRDMADMPGMDMSGSGVPVTAAVELPNSVRVEVTADPARAGAAVLTLTIRSLSGAVVDPPEVDVTAENASAGISAITLSPVRAEAGRFTVDALQLLLPGTWKITLTVRTTDVDAGVGTVDIPLGPA
jgi:copper transport protein